MTRIGPNRVLSASHNIMHGRRLAALCDRYRALPSPATFCVQENERTDDGSHAERIATALGPTYRITCQPEAPGLATLHDDRAVAAADAFLVPLPRLEKLTWFERRYIRGGRTKQKYCLVTLFRPAASAGATGDGAPFAVANFHLDTAGGNGHRGDQVQAIADALVARGLAARFLACGDTNAFTFGKGRHAEELARLLAPLTALGATDPETRPTHWFARQDEPTLVHQTGCWLGKCGLDVPLRYDVCCTNLSVEERGQLETPESDHDLVWVRWTA